MLLLIEKKKLSLRSPARAREINQSLLFRNSQQYYLFVCPLFRTYKSFCVWCVVSKCGNVPNFFFPHATGDESHTTKTQTLFSFSFGLPPSACRSITAREERTRSARDTKKGKRVVCSSRELARARLREKERER